MYYHNEVSPKELFKAFRKKEIQLGGNLKLKIYGTLHCKSGRRLKKENRVFFATEEEAKSFGFRPCGHCLKTAYKTWKNGLI